MVALDVERRLSALTRLTSEYHDLPGLRLTTAQAARLCGLSVLEAEALLTALMISGYLYRDHSGRYASTVTSAQGDDVAGVEGDGRRLHTTH